MSTKEDIAEIVASARRAEVTQIREVATERSSVMVRTYQKGPPGYEIKVVSGATETEMLALVELAQQSLLFATEEAEE